MTEMSRRTLGAEGQACDAVLPLAQVLRGCPCHTLRRLLRVANTGAIIS